MFSRYVAQITQKEINEKERSGRIWGVFHMRSFIFRVIYLSIYLRGGSAERLLSG